MMEKFKYILFIMWLAFTFTLSVYWIQSKISEYIYMVVIFICFSYLIDKVFKKGDR